MIMHGIAGVTSVTDSNTKSSKSTESEDSEKEDSEPELIDPTDAPLSTAVVLAACHSLLWSIVAFSVIRSSVWLWMQSTGI